MLKTKASLFLFTLFTLLASCQKLDMTNRSQTQLNQSNHIVNGQLESNPSARKAILKFSLKNDFGDWRICSAAYLGKNMFLTARHCTNPNSSGSPWSNYSLLDSAHQLWINRSSADIQNWPVADLNHVELAYNPAADVTLGIFERPLQNEFNSLSESSAFRLPKASDTLPEQLFVSGYGWESFEQPEDFEYNESTQNLNTLKIDVRTQRLQSLDTYINNNNFIHLDPFIQNFLMETNQSLKLNNVLCFKTNQHLSAATHGDSGAPIYSIEPNGKLVLWGIFSKMVYAEKLHLEKKDQKPFIEFYCGVDIRKKISWIKNYLN